MIIEIPTAEDFYAAGASQLHLAWHLCMRAVQDYDTVLAFVDVDERSEATDDYWRRTQPALANAFSLTQQAMEMALKGRIAAVSPYLLIGRDPKDWPKGIDADPVPFSEFRTLDASDLIRVHNSVAETPLDHSFTAFWEEVRRDRNRIMHSIRPRTFDPGILVRTILEAVEVFFADIPWPRRLLRMEVNGQYDTYSIGDSTHNVVMRQVEIAVRHLPPKEAMRFLRFNKRQRAYRCPSCCSHSEEEWHEGVPPLAQFPTGVRAATKLNCIVCEQNVEVSRIKCANTECPADVIHAGMCLVCRQDQDSPHLFRSGLEIEDRPGAVRYNLTYGHGTRGAGGCVAQDARAFPDDEAAVEHGRRAMGNAYLALWETVTIEQAGTFSIVTLEKGNPDRLIGTWRRTEAGVVWIPDIVPDHFGIGGRAPAES